MKARLLAALLLLFLPSLAHAQAWSSVQLVTSADNAQQLILRSADGSAPRRIRVDNLVGNPITNATLSGSTLTITFRNGTTRNLDLPSGGGGGGGGLTTDQARDTAGALVATLPTFTYDAAANTLAWANNSIPAAYAQTSSATTLRAWRSRLGVADDWSEIPNGTAISSGKVVEHGGGYYGAITSHTKSSTGPDGDAANWVLLSNFRGAWSNAWWPAGTIMTRGGLPWVATSAVVLNDPAPDASNNTKWLALGTLPPSVVIASSNTSIPASADGNTYVHTGSSNITYTLPAASGGSAVDNGWQVVVSNQGAGDLTIDGNGSDTVDGAATLVITTNGRAVRLQKIANTAWATIADTKDEVGTGGGTTLTDAQIGDKAFSNPPSDLTAVEQKAVRLAVDSAKIAAGNALPAATATNVGDIHIFTQAVASGLSWRDISAPSTVITSALAGDVAAYFDRQGWTRVGNILGSSQNLLLDTPGSPIAATATNARHVLYRAGDFYRNEAVHTADPSATYRAFAASDLPAGYTWGGAVQVNPGASTVTDNRVVYSIPANRFERKITTGGVAFWVGYNVANWRGPVADESAADRTVQAVGDVVFFGGSVQVVATFTARTPDRWQWTRIRDDELIARVAALEGGGSTLSRTVLADLQSRTADLRVTSPPSWDEAVGTNVGVDVSTTQVTDFSSLSFAATGKVVPPGTLAANIYLYVAVPTGSNLSDYRVNFGRLNVVYGPSWTLRGTVSGNNVYEYIFQRGNSTPEQVWRAPGNTLVLEHHGTSGHTAYSGTLEGEAITSVRSQIDGLAISLALDFPAGSLSSVEQVAPTDPLSAAVIKVRNGEFSRIRRATFRATIAQVNGEDGIELKTVEALGALDMATLNFVILDIPDDALLDDDKPLKWAIEGAPGVTITVTGGSPRGAITRTSQIPRNHSLVALYQSVGSGLGFNILAGELPRSSGSLTAAQIGDQAFSNPPSDLTTQEQTAVRTAIGAGTGGGGTFNLRTAAGTKATPEVADRFVFTDENQAGDPLRYAEFQELVPLFVTDDSVLDTAAASRTTADRGKVLKISATDENAIVLADDQTASAGSGEPNNVRVYLNASLGNVNTLSMTSPSGKALTSYPDDLVVVVKAPADLPNNTRVSIDGLAHRIILDPNGDAIEATVWTVFEDQWAVLVYDSDQSAFIVANNLMPVNENELAYGDHVAPDGATIVPSSLGFAARIKTKFTKLDLYPGDPTDVPVNGENVLFFNSYVIVAYNETAYNNRTLQPLQIMFNNATIANATAFILGKRTTSPDSRDTEFLRWHGVAGREVHVYGGPSSGTASEWDAVHRYSELYGTWRGVLRTPTGYQEPVVQFSFDTSTLVRAALTGRVQIGFESPIHATLRHYTTLRPLTPSGSGATRTYTLDPSVHEIWFGGTGAGNKNVSATWPRAFFTSTAQTIVLDDRNPGESRNPDTDIVAANVSISGNTLTVNKTGFRSANQPLLVYVK